MVLYYGVFMTCCRVYYMCNFLCFAWSRRDLVLSAFLLMLFPESVVRSLLLFLLFFWVLFF